MKNRYYITVAFLCLISCQTSQTDGPEKVHEIEFTTFGQDVAFLEDYTPIIQLSDPSSQGMVAISAALQGRVMTSSSSGYNGRSYGWINRPHFESGDTLDNINVFGGEERFWLGPEGGQFSIFFEAGSEFDLDSWKTPGLIDLEPYEIKTTGTNEAVFTKSASLTNYSGFTFELGIERAVKILSAKEITEQLGLSLPDGTLAVGYQTTNTLTNTGEMGWAKETGLLSIWLLGMFNPSPTTAVIVPYIQGDIEQLGVPVNDDYFGKVPSERLTVKENVIYFSGDGKFRSKIGLSSQRAKNVMGSYDASNKVLTIVKYQKPEGTVDYVNSLWELQDQPYKGDVVNSYNDGPPEPGKKPLGPFYELETSSPALLLEPGESGTHVQLTCHFEGDEAALSQISEVVLGVSIEEIKRAFE